ncbi:MAG TPA: glutamate racemase [Luteibaculaceae bacterium]|nr:glutamate racemase [Luteibaculaceae bacterium]
MQAGPIGFFDSGYGGLTVLREVVRSMPEYDCVYLGDNARAPYGTRSYETVYAYTLECVEQLFDMGCQLVILACNTASAKALRTIQQRDLPRLGSEKRVLGVIRPTAEAVGSYTQSGHVGVLGTTGTVLSDSYPIEIGKLHPNLIVEQEACPMWVPLVENNEIHTPAADYFVEYRIKAIFSRDPKIDTLILGCTHYPLLMPVIERHLPQGVALVEQGTIVAEKLRDYLLRHPEMDERCTKGGVVRFYTTDSPSNFDQQATQFFGSPVKSAQITVQHHH